MIDKTNYLKMFSELMFQVFDSSSIDEIIQVVDTYTDFGDTTKAMTKETLNKIRSMKTIFSYSEEIKEKSNLYSLNEWKMLFDAYRCVNSSLKIELMQKSIFTVINGNKMYVVEIKQSETELYFEIICVFHSNVDCPILIVFNGNNPINNVNERFNVVHNETKYCFEKSIDLFNHIMIC